jgi:hypothetical protein
MSSTAEARFRIAESQPTHRVVKVVRLDHVSDADIGEATTADLVVMVTTAGADAPAAAMIGEACSRRSITTATVVVRGRTASDEMLSKSLAQVRPWSLMVVVADDERYVDDLLTSFR